MTPPPSAGDPAEGGPFLVRRIAVGSTNPGKITAVREAAGRLWPHAVVEGVDVPSGVPEQPRTDRDGVLGALNRAAGAQALTGADLGIGLEGTADEQAWGVFTLAWVAVVARDGRVGLGSSGRCPLPGTVAAGIRAGDELGPLVDRLVGARNTKHGGGASAAFTAGHTGRVESLTAGVIYACAPFLTPAYFGAEALGRLPAVRARLLESGPLRTAYTLVFVRRPDGRILFLERTRPPNRGRLNGLGGDVEPGEDILEAARREVAEEAGIRVAPRLGLVITLHEAGRQARGESPITLHVCPADVDTGVAAAVPATSSEGPLRWLDPALLAGQPVVPNIRIMLPLLFSGESGGAWSGTFWYEAGWQGGRYLLHTPEGPRRGPIPDA